MKWNGDRALTWGRKVALILACSGLAAFLPAALGQTAERIRLTLSPLEITVSIESLEIFAKEGRVRRDLAPFVRRLSPEQRVQVRSLLQKRFDVGPTTIARATYSPMAESFLRRVGFLIQQDARANGFYALRAAAILSAADETEGLTVLNFLRQFPGQDIRIDIRDVLYILREFQTQNAYRDAAIQAIAQQAAQEAATLPSASLSQFPDLRQRGRYSVTQKTVTFEINAIRPTGVGFAPTYPLLVDFYLPDNAPTPLPLIVYTHGFGANRFNNAYVAEHLASHGFAVATPEHIGSNLEYRANFLQGKVSDIISPIEFISRALDTTYLLDELEQRDKTDPEWRGKLNLSQVGTMGASFGGTTALGLAGAEIQSDRLQAECQETIPIFSLSPLLQCYAQYLPPANYSVRDPRIKAAFAAYPPSGILYGPEGFGKVEIPTLILTGSHDVVMSPAVDDQIHPFVWLQTPQKYLALMVPGTHFSSSAEAAEAIPEFMRGPALEVGRSYQAALSVAFFQAHLVGDTRYLPYLSETYAKTISQPQLTLNIVRSLTSQQLEQAYGQTPPKPIVPPPVATTSRRRETVLDEIRRSRVLRVALRTDAAPLGYIDAQGQWVGYCIDAINALRSHLERSLNLPAESLDVVRLPTSQSNRLTLVQEGTAHLECGPEAAQRDQPVAFSQPFFVSGTQLLVPAGQETNLSPTSAMSIGTLSEAAATAVAAAYPKTQRTAYLTAAEANAALQALQRGALGAIADDGILLLGRLAQRGLASDSFAVVPPNPLDCRFYSLVLPQGDNRWQSMVNAFITSTQARQVRDRWLQQSYPTALPILEYCSNPARQ
jgi:predicted dienelactone hydrolase